MSETSSKRFCSIKQWKVGKDFAKIMTKVGKPILQIPVYLSANIYLGLFIILYTFQSFLNFTFYLSICLSVHLSICLSVYLSICLSVYLSICLSVHLSVYISVYLSSYLSICLSLTWSVWLSKLFPSICSNICRLHTGTPFSNTFLKSDLEESRLFFKLILSKYPFSGNQSNLMNRNSLRVYHSLTVFIISQNIFIFLCNWISAYLFVDFSIIYLFIYESLSINPILSQSFYLSISLFLNLFNSRSLYLQSLYLSISLSVNLFISQFLYLSIS